MIHHAMFFTITLFSFINIYAAENTLKRPAGYWTAKEENIFTRRTEPGSQRENWYEHTPYIAETFATISNAGFFMVANSVKQSYPLSAAALTLAGSLSAISHAVPYQSLNYADTIGAIASVAAITYDAKLYQPDNLVRALTSPMKVLALLATGAVYLADVYIARSEEIVKKSKFPESMIVTRKGEHKWMHVLWHILAASTAHALLTN